MENGRNLISALTTSAPRREVGRLKGRWLLVRGVKASTSPSRPKLEGRDTKEDRNPKSNSIRVRPSRILPSEFEVTRRLRLEVLLATRSPGTLGVYRGD